MLARDAVDQEIGQASALLFNGKMPKDESCKLLQATGIISQWVLKAFLSI